MQSQQLLHLDDMDFNVFEPGAFVHSPGDDPIETKTCFQVESRCSTFCNAETPDGRPVGTTEGTPAVLSTPLQVTRASNEEVQQCRKAKRECEETSRPAGYNTTTTTSTSTGNTGKSWHFGSRKTTASALEGAAAVADFCSDMGWGVSGESPVSSVECNAEDDGEDFEDQLSHVKKFASENVREQHLYSSDIGSRFCHSTAMSRFNRACVASAPSIFSPAQPLGSMEVRERAERMHGEQSVPQSSSAPCHNGNTALNFTSNDVSIVRAFAISLLEEKEKKKGNRRHRNPQLQDEEEGVDDYLSYM